MKNDSLLCAAMAMLLALSACGQRPAEDRDPDKLTVVATVFPAYDFARAAGGDLAWEETLELVRRIQNCSVTGQEWAMRYDLQLLRRSLSLPNVMDFVASGEDVEVIAEKLLQAAR